MSLSAQFLDEVRARTSLSALIMRTVPLKRAGAEWKACCPFHDEKGPSFYVNDSKHFYHCFGCGAHGDCISWLTEQGGMQFMDAVKELAGAAGMDMPAMDSRQSERDREHGIMLEHMARAARWFADNLANNSGTPLLGFIRDRALASAIEPFQVGYAPRGRAAPTLLEHMADVPIDMMVKLGLAKQKPDGEKYDAFRGRVMFPIQDTRGRVIGFGGRILGEGEPKYLNSPDTPLFDKGRTLYNAHRAAPAARKANRLVIVEGYMDVIALYRAGVTEAVAPNGTALTEAQMMAAWRMVDEPILCMDGDKAGQAAMARAAIKALPLLEPGKSLSFAIAPAGKDPDDLLREGGLEAVQKLLASPVPLSHVLWHHELYAQPTDTPEQVAGFKARMRAHVRSIKNSDVRQAYGQDIAKRFHTTFDAQSEGVTSGPQIRSSHTTERQQFSRRPAPASADQRQIKNAGLAQEIERGMFIGLQHFPDLLPGAHKSFRNERARSLIERLAELANLNNVSSEDEMDSMLEGTKLEEEIDQMSFGRSLPFRYAKPIIRPEHRDEARLDLAAALKSSTKP